jgi:hypothetical protein
MIENQNPHFCNINRPVRCERNKTVIYVSSDTQKNVFQDMFNVLWFPWDSSYYYVYISPAYLPNWHHGTISYKKDQKYIGIILTKDKHMVPIT